MRRIDLYTRAARTSYNLNRWVCLRIDAIGALFASGLAVYLVYFQSRGAADTGFSLNMAGKNTSLADPLQAHLAPKVGFSGMIIWWVRTLNEFEVQANR